MKILIVNLLRLGDFILAAPVCSALKRKFPNARLDVLVHEPVARLRPNFADVDRWLTFDRDGFQSGLGQGDIPLLTAFDVLREQLDALNDEGYDLVINLTHTRLSGYLMGYLKARAKMGLTLDASGGVHFHSPWFRHLNEHAEAVGENGFHHLDIFSYACEHGESHREFRFSPTREGLCEVDALKLSGRELIAVQALTSDHKKNWGTKSWASWLDEMTSLRSDADIVLLGAETEREALGEILASMRKPGPRVRISTLSLDGALALLNRATLLVTGDTSIKHLANAASCRVMELSLGSSDYRRTGIYKPGSWIIQGAAECAPCRHSSPCGQARHFCAERLLPGPMARLAVAALLDDEASIRGIAREMGRGANVMRTKLNGNGFWYACDVLLPAPEKILTDWVQRSAWKVLLNGEDRTGLPRIGSEVYRLGEEMAGLVGESGLRPLLDHLDFIEKELVELPTRASEPVDASAGGVVDLGRLRARQIRTEAEQREVKIKEKLIRSLKSHFRERAL